MKYETMDSEKINENCPRYGKNLCYWISSSLEAVQWPFRGLVISHHVPQCPNNIVIFWFFNNVGNYWHQREIKIKNVICYIHSDGSFDLKIHAVVVWGGGNLYNLDEMEREMIFYKTMKKIFSNLFSTWEKCVSCNCGNFCRTTH